jgi:type IV pilus assembly protein PilM
MPKLNEKELLSAVKYQADQFIPMPLEDTNIDIEIVYDDLNSHKNLALIVAAPKKIIQKIERTVERAGLAPVIIESEISAAGRLFSSIFKPQASLTNAGYLFINFGSQTTSLYFFDIQKNILVYSHNFAIGYGLFIKEIQVNLNVDKNKAEELLKTFGITPNSSYHLETILAPAIKDFLTEIQHSTTLITSTFKKQIQGVYMFNNTAKFHGFDVLIGKYLAIPSATLNISSFFTKNNISSLHREDMAYFIPAVGGNLT